MFDGPYALALAAGMAATVNPCGFALLPAYLSAFVGTDQNSSRATAVVRALRVTGALTVGFVVVFGLFGIIVTPLALSIDEHLPWVTIAIGLGLVGFGVALGLGREFTVRLPKLQAGGRDGSLLSMFLFGVSYAVASLSCTIGPFLAVTTSTFRSSSWLAGSAVFAAYALGMGVVIGTLTVALALAKSGIVRRFRHVMARINRVAGVLMIVAGLYVAYYGWYERRVLTGDDGDDPIIERAVRIQSWLANTVVPDNPVRIAVTLVVVLAALAGVSVTRSRRGARAAHNDLGDPDLGDPDLGGPDLGEPDRGGIVS